MEIKVPENVEKIINTLEEAGFEAYAVGGCVRDSILGRTPADWDITTSAKPEDIKSLFKKTFDTGIKHGTVSVLMDKVVYEVTTYRIDGEYIDSRHPESVIFTDRLSEDLLRRDFTINAMAYNPTRGLVDLYGGQEDLANGIIRCVGNAVDRFSEDALRMLRAIRFAAQLGYVIDEDTKEAIRELAPTLSKISAERIQVELVKTLVSDHPERLKTACELGVTAVILPEVDAMMTTPQHNPHHRFSVGGHTMAVVDNVRPDKVLRLAALLHDVGKPATRSTDSKGVDHFYDHPNVSGSMARTILHRLKFDNDTITRVSRLCEVHDWTINADPKHIRRYINRIGEEYFPDIFELNLADTMGQSEYLKEEKLKLLEELREGYEQVIAKGECVSLKTLAVTGNDLVKAGIKPGPQIGEILDKMLKVVIDNPSKNNKEELMKLI